MNWATTKNCGPPCRCEEPKATKQSRWSKEIVAPRLVGARKDNMVGYKPRPYAIFNIYHFTILRFAQEEGRNSFTPQIIFRLDYR